MENIHSIKNIIPENYSFVTFYNYTEWKENTRAYVIEANGDLVEHLEETKGKLFNTCVSRCDICNAHISNNAIFYHKPSNEYIRVGLDCAKKLNNKEVFNAYAKYKKNQADYTALTNGKAKAKAILSENNLFHLYDLYWELAEKQDKDHFAYFDKNQKVILSIVGNLIKYGKISDKQINFLKVVNSYMAKKEVSEDMYLKEGRCQVVGTIVKTQIKETRYGDIAKATIKFDNGSKAYGSIPDKVFNKYYLEINKNELVGKEVKFTGTFEQSDNDQSFGFYSRPSKFELVA